MSNELVIHRSNSYYKEGALDTERWSKIAELPDYNSLLSEFDWATVFSSRTGELTLLDCGCGPGHFPKALNDQLQLEDVTIQYDTVDPSEYSLTTHRRNLQLPFIARNSFNSTIQSFSIDETTCRYDIIWCIHSLYTIPRSKVKATLTNLRNLLSSNGQCFIYLPCKASAYMQFYDLYLSEIAKDDSLDSYLTAEEIVAALDSIGATSQVTSCKFDHVIGYDDVKTMETYLNQNSLRPDPQLLPQWKENSAMKNFIEECSLEAGWTFRQDVWLISFGRN